MEKGNKKQFGFKVPRQEKIVESAGRDNLTIEEKLKRLEAEVLASKTPAMPTTVSSTKIESGIEGKPEHNMVIFWTVVVLTVVLSKFLPFSDVVFAPLTQFATMIHEMGHALACLATGGHVEGMTIVSDGAGHGGLTFMRGGIPFIQAQAGYLGTAFFGCLLVYVGQFRKLSKHVLVAIGLVMTTASIVFIGRALFSASFLQALFSLVWALALSGGIIWAGLRLKERTANIVLLVLAVYTSLDSLRAIWIVVMASAASTTVMSDASQMQSVYGLPAIFWAVSWALVSIVMLSFTVWYVYGTGALKRLENKDKKKGMLQLFKRR